MDSSQAASCSCDEIARFRAKVLEDPLDWANAEALLKAADRDVQAHQLSDQAIITVRESYSLFLGRFPYCFGFWKRWAEHELSLASVAGATTAAKESAVRATISVYERGVASVPYSVEMWVAYCSWLQKHLAAQESGAMVPAVISADDVRRTLNRAIEVCALDPKAVQLWNMLIEWELNTQPYPSNTGAAGSAAEGDSSAPVVLIGNLPSVSAAYARLFSIPGVPYVDAMWNKFRTWVASSSAAAAAAAVAGSSSRAIMRSALELVNPYDPAEHTAVYQRAQQLDAAKKQAALAAYNAATGGMSGYDNDGNPISISTENDNNANNSSAEGHNGSSGNSSGAEGDRPSDESLKQSVMELREQAYALSSQQAAARRAFEAAVAKRSWFHVKPLDAVVLNGWRQYLAFEESQGLNNAWRAEKLYGRCLVACANYSEFWLRYAAWKRETTRAQAKLAAAAASAAAAAGGGAPTVDSSTSAIEAQASLAAASILHQACEVFLPRRIDLHLYLACLYEASGEQHRERASHVFQRMAAWAGESAEVCVRHANALRRGGDLAAATQVLKEALGRPGVRSDPQALAGVFAAYAAVTEQARPWCASTRSEGDGEDEGASSSALEAVRAAHEEAVVACPGEASVWLKFVDLEARVGAAAAATSGKANEDAQHRIRSLFRRALGLDSGSASTSSSSSPLSDESRALLYASYVSVMDARASDASLLLEAVDAAYEWERRRLLAAAMPGAPVGSSADGIGVLATTAVAAARYALPQASRDHAGAAAGFNGGLPVVGKKRGALEAGLGTASEANAAAVMAGAAGGASAVPVMPTMGAPAFAAAAASSMGTTAAPMAAQQMWGQLYQQMQPSQVPFFQ